MSNKFVHDPIKPKKAVNQVLIDIMQYVVVVLAIVVVIYLFVFIPNQVDGKSMLPNFHNNDQLLTNKINQFVGGKEIGDKLRLDYTRGDVIIFQKPGYSDFIKRVVALPGDEVTIKNGSIYINKVKLVEDYIPLEMKTKPYDFEEGKTRIVPDEHFFLVGDNRDNSRDSRFRDIGFVSRDYMKGKVLIRYQDCDLDGACKPSFEIIKRGDTGYDGNAV